MVVRIFLTERQIISFVEGMINMTFGKEMIL